MQRATFVLKPGLARFPITAYLAWRRQDVLWSAHQQRRHAAAPKPWCLAQSGWCSVEQISTANGTQIICSTNILMHRPCLRHLMRVCAIMRGAHAAAPGAATLHGRPRGSNPQLHELETPCNSMRLCRSTGSRTENMAAGPYHDSVPGAWWFQGLAEAMGARVIAKSLPCNPARCRMKCCVLIYVIQRHPL